jgi:hypothetical protein
MSLKEKLGLKLYNEGQVHPEHLPKTTIKNLPTIVDRMLMLGGDKVQNFMAILSHLDVVNNLNTDVLIGIPLFNDKLYLSGLGNYNKIGEHRYLYIVGDEISVVTCKSEIHLGQSKPKDYWTKQIKNDSHNFTSIINQLPEKMLRALGVDERQTTYKLGGYEVSSTSSF